jgi:hypothetical protein
MEIVPNRSLPKKKMTLGEFWANEKAWDAEPRANTRYTLSNKGRAATANEAIESSKE